MTIIDRYILRGFVFNFVGLNICFIGIFIIIDLFSSLDSLIQAGKDAGSIPKIIFLYYLYKSIPYLMPLSSFLCLGSAMVTVAFLIRSNELISIQAAGISSLRIVRPLLIAVLTVTGLFCLVQELVLPKIQDQITMEASEIAKNSGTLFNVTIDGETGINISGDRAFRDEKRIVNPEFTFPYEIVRQTLNVKGKEAFQQSATKSRPAGYLVTGIQDKNIAQHSSLMWNGKPILISPMEDASLEPDQCFVVSNVPFESLASSDAWKYASLWSLVSAARNKSLDISTSVHAAIHSRLTQPILDISVLLLGLPIIISRRDQNVFKSMGWGVLTLGAFFLVCYTCRFAGANSGMPVLGAWLPMIIFVPLAVNQFFLLKET